MQKIRFISEEKQSFFNTVKIRVDEYFKENNISKNANHHMIIKTVVMLSLYLIPYFLIISNTFSIGLMSLFCIIMGLGLAGVGMSVMHDANHGSYSNKKIINKILGYSLNIIGANAFTWRIKHNILHHGYTNINDIDEDLDAMGFLRLSPHQEKKPIHKYQHLYAFLVYSFVTLEWAVSRDFVSLKRYIKKGIIEKGNRIKKEFNILLWSKIIYFGLVVLLPILLLSVVWWKVLIGFLIIHATAGLILASTFQLAHVVEETIYTQPDEQGNVKNNWAIHQLMTTANFCPDNKILSWFIGGLNYQIEHHLFPNICHVHYEKIARIVKETAIEYGLPYNQHKNLLDAYVSHYKLMRRLGSEAV